MDTYTAIATALHTVRPFITEGQYHRMKQQRSTPAFFMIVQWENCVNSICHAIAERDPAFNSTHFLSTAGYIWRH